jgi:hypothetical protein
MTPSGRTGYAHRPLLRPSDEQPERTGVGEMLEQQALPCVGVGNTIQHTSLPLRVRNGWVMPLGPLARVSASALIAPQRDREATSNA